MSKLIALAAFNTAIVATNVVHATKRGVVKAAPLAKDATVTSASATKDAGVAFWAGLKYANEINRAQGKTAECLKAKDIEPEVEVEEIKPATKTAKAPKAKAKPATTTDDVTDVEVEEIKPAAKTTKATKAKPAAKA